MGATPNFILCLTLVFSFLYKGYQGIIFGVIFGLLQDIGFSILIGPSALIYLLIGLVMGEVRYYMYRDSILNLFLASAIGTGAYYTLYWLILMVFKGNYTFLHMARGLPILFVSHFIIIVLFYVFVGQRAIRHRGDRYYRSRKFYGIN